MTTISFQCFFLLLCWRMILFFVRFEATDAADITGRLYTLRTAAVGLNLDRAESPKNIHKMGTYYGAGRKKKKGQRTMCRMIIFGRSFIWNHSGCVDFKHMINHLGSDRRRKVRTMAAWDFSFHCMYNYQIFVFFAGASWRRQMDQRMNYDLQDKRRLDVVEMTMCWRWRCWFSSVGKWPTLMYFKRNIGHVDLILIVCRGLEI